MKCADLLRLLCPAAVAATFLATGGCMSAQRAAEMEAAAARRSSLPGEQAPGFALPNAAGEKVLLSQQRGHWVVLYFYPKNGTPGCACQAHEFTQTHDQFARLNARVFGISPDPVASHRQVTEEFGLEVTLLSDPDHDTMRDYGAWVDTPFGGRVVRSTVLIDPQGVIAYHWPEVIPEGHAERVQKQLAKIRQERGADGIPGKSGSS